MAEFDVEYSNCSNGQMRLSGSSLRGRVEICYNNTWFGVCSDLYYTYNNPQVVCSALGYSDASGYVDAFSDLDGIPLIPYRFNCNGNEKSLLDCAKSTSACSGYNSYYGHIYYAGVTCQLACNHSDIRLAGSPYETFGRVEVCINGTWGTVCSNDFDSDDAEVVCSHLGYSQYGAIILPYNAYYARYLDVHIYSLSCTGNETNIWDCPYVLQNNQYCYYRYDAAVHCQYFNDTVDTSCVTGDVRLVGGTNELEGTVELCYNKFWGPVCHRSWDVTDANVVCKQLGYQSKGSTRFTNAYFGEGTGPYIISDLSCYSSSTTLLSCYSNFINTVLCGDSASAGVSCVDPCDEGSVRLSGSTIQFAGRVEICIENTWTTLCDQSWDLSDAQVACRELGYSPYGAIPTYGCYTEGQLSFGITSLNCVGNEDSLINCSHSSPSLYNCWSYNDAGLVCQISVNETNCSNGEIRLVDGKVPNEGRVEICLNKVWGTICSSSWSIVDSNIACRQLGYLPRGSTPMNNAHYGQGTGPVLMSQLYCDGSEDSLLECNHRSCGVTSCTHHHDAGVFCEVPCTNGSMRLGSNAVLKGRVEFCVNNSWVTICTHHWTTSEASVICSQLGYSRYGATATSDYYYNYYNYGWPMGVYQLHCIGTETTIDECQYNTSYSGPGCYSSWYYNNVAAVSCMPNTTEYVNCVDGDVRLVGGATHNEGNVQMCYSNAWGSVCDDYWDTRDTNVVCRQLGFKPSDSIPYRYNYFGVANSPPFVHGMFNCLGSELSLITCSIHSYYYSFLYRCYDYEIAGVKCEVNPEIHLEKAQINTEYNISTLSLTCSAVGATSYHWTDLSTGNVVSNSSMHHVNIESSINSPGYLCTALNKNSSTTATIRGANRDSC
jgi:deleted-in-malignant-brain-tumors protein 1